MKKGETGKSGVAKSLRKNSLLTFFLFSLFSVLIVQSALAQRFSPPRRPDVAPRISSAYHNDRDGDRIDDALSNRAEIAAVSKRFAVTMQARQNARERLSEKVNVELIFSEQVTQRQIDEFLRIGGEIDYIYKAVSYGWNAKIPLSRIRDVPLLMGSDMLLIEETKQAEHHMRLATQTGRVRPVWAEGFAGGSGYQGNSSISIAIIDTGVDESHTDLTGRNVYWNDYTSDGAASPVDIVQHGTHVAGIALGTGASLGTGTTLMYTDSGNLSGIPLGNFFPAVIDFPSVSTSWNSTATWLGGGTTTLYHAYTVKGTSSWFGLNSQTGASGLNLSTFFTPSSFNAYSAALLSNSAMTTYAVANSMTNFSIVGDGFNTLQGVAPGCNWVGAKVFRNNGTGIMSDIGSAIDDIVAQRDTYDIKVMNLSLGAIGDPGISTSVRQKINNAALNGIIPVVSAGNDGAGSGGANEVDDPGRAAMALTVGASNDINELTEYTSSGFLSPSSTSGQEEDYKPDVLAPGGSDYYSHIMSVDSNDADGKNSSFSDVQSDDYYNIKGTSMAAPFASGIASLVIDALQSTGGLTGASWDFSSSNDVRRVKMLLCATSTETNTNREAGTGYNPSLQRASAGPDGYPAGKDRYEGYGMLNVDAAIEGGTVAYAVDTVETETLGGSDSDRRAWARKAGVTAGESFELSLTVPAGGDFDLYLYSYTPTSYGTPSIIASSANPGNGVPESITYTPGANNNVLVVVKRVSGDGEFTLDSNYLNYTLEVNISGTGSGTVTSSPAGVDCGSDCTEEYAVDTVVALTAAPAADSVFAGWSGDADCSDGTVTMNASAACTATFDLLSYPLDISTAGTGSGTVTSSPAGVDCGSDCTEEYALDTIVTLSAAPDADSTFAGWTGDGDCSDGTVTMSGARACTASFDIIQYQLTTVASPLAGGAISPDCSSGCLYDSGILVVLTASPSGEYYLDGWTNCDSPSNSICTETVDTDDTVTATFQACPLAVKISGVTPEYYSTLQEAYDAAVTGDTIQSRAVVLTEDFSADRDISVTVNGGYDCNYTAVTGITTVDGSMNVIDGEITISDFLLSN